MLLLVVNNSAPLGCQPVVHIRNQFPVFLLYLLLLRPLHYVFLIIVPLYPIIVLRCLLRKLNKGLKTKNVHLYGPISNLMMHMLPCISLYVMIIIVILIVWLSNLIPVQAGLTENYINTSLNLSLIKLDNK